MKVTVCELANDLNELAGDWEALVRHVRSEASDLVLLPEAPFHPWIARTDHFDPAVWQASVEAHDRWMGRLARQNRPIRAMYLAERSRFGPESAFFP